MPQIANQLRDKGFHVFDDWFAAGPRADDEWQAYETSRGRSYLDALDGLAARHVFRFDHDNMRMSDVGVLVLPAGKSGHLELGYMLGQGKPGHILITEEPERWDVMLQFATGIHNTLDSLVEALRG